MKLLLLILSTILSYSIAQSPFEGRFFRILGTVNRPGQQSQWVVTVNFPEREQDVVWTIQSSQVTISVIVPYTLDTQNRRIILDWTQVVSVTSNDIEQPPSMGSLTTLLDHYDIGTFEYVGALPANAMEWNTAPDDDDDYILHIPSLAPEIATLEQEYSPSHPAPGEDYLRWIAYSCAYPDHFHPPGDKHRALEEGVRDER